MNIGLRPTVNKTVNNNQANQAKQTPGVINTSASNFESQSNSSAQAYSQLAAMQRKVEVHILDWSGDIYGQELRVDLIDFLRPEQKFPSLDDLKVQIAADCQSALRILQKFEADNYLTTASTYSKQS
jgi:FAD synthase